MAKTAERRAAIYARVSTDQQTVENQLRELQAVADRAGWEIVATYSDNGISGAKARDKRPQFTAMLKAAARREFDVVMAWHIDRLGRSLLDLLNTLEELHKLGRDVYLHQQGIDTTTPMGKLMFSVSGAFAEFERSMLAARTRAGLARARAAGKTLGRPKVSPAKERKIRKLLDEGLSIRKVAHRARCGISTVQRVKRGA